MAALTTCPTCHTPVRGRDERNQATHYEPNMPPVFRLPCGHVHALESGTWGAISSATAASNNPFFIRLYKSLGLM